MPHYIVQKDNKSVSAIWQTCHVTTYAVTGLLGLASSIVLYLGLDRSHYHCYQYNAVLMVNEWSRDKYESYLSDQTVWYQNKYCYDAFVFPLIVFINSTVWMSLCIVFGRGGTVLSEFDYSEYFGAIVIEQWRIILWAALFNLWFWKESIIIALRFTDGYRKFLTTILQLPVHDSFRDEYLNEIQPYYVTFMVLLWCLSLMCTFNFVLMVYRCAAGVDFDFKHQEDDNIDLDSTGPSNRQSVRPVSNDLSFCAR